MSLLNSTEIAAYTGSIYDHFQTFKRQIIIYKEPTESYASESVDLIMGYNNNTNQNNITYTRVSGIFSGLKVGPDKLGSENISLLKLDRNQENSYIKVEKDCREFIDRGVTDYLEIDKVKYKKMSDAKVKNYLGLIYYIFDIERIK